MRDKNLLTKTWRGLTRLNVAAVIILLVLLLTAPGSCFPQLSPPITTDAARLAHWQTSVQTRYGGSTDFLAALDVFDWFHAPPFLTSLALLAVAMLVCTLDRWRAVWWRVFRAPVNSPDAMFETAACTASLQAPSLTAPLLLERLRERGFYVRVETSGDTHHLRGDRNRLNPLATLVTHLAVLLLLLGAILSSRFGWQNTLTLNPGETAGLREGSLSVRNDDFSIIRYANGAVANYEAAITLLEAGQEMARRPIRVNEPLTYNGIGLYLRGYGGSEGRYSITLLAKRDPGYGLVITAGFLLLFGLTVSFYLPHYTIHARISADGVLRLAGRAGRYAHDFEREFAALVAELGGRPC